MNVGALGLTKWGIFLQEVVLKLNSRFVKEQMEGLRHIIALMTAGQDASGYFPQVVKLVVSKSFEVKKLAYSYLVKYSEGRPDDAIMCVNEFQKALGDDNPLVRAMALRVMSSIRVRMIVQIVIMALKKCALDPSPYVRKAAAHAVPKVFSLDREQKDTLEEIIERMLLDRSPMVLGSVAFAFMAVCPERLDLLHQPYRKICGLLPEMDEWGQLRALDMLHRYCRQNFADPRAAYEKSGAEGGAGSPIKRGGAQTSLGESLGEENLDNFLGGERSPDGKGEKCDNGSGGRELPSGAGGDGEGGGVLDSAQKHLSVPEDLVLLLRSSWPLLRSRNTGVIVAVVGLNLDMGNPSVRAHMAEALVFALRSSRQACHYLLLDSISYLIGLDKALFEQYLSAFFVNVNDSLHVRAQKLHALSSIVTPDTVDTLLRELQAYIRDSAEGFVANVVRTIGRVGSEIPKVRKRSLATLVMLTRHPSDLVAAEAVQTVLAMVDRETWKSYDVVLRLVQNYSDFNDEARASVLYLSTSHLLDGADAAPEEDDVADALAENLNMEDGPEDMSDSKDGKKKRDKKKKRKKRVLSRAEALGLLNDLAPEALRVASARFSSESAMVKIEILNMSLRLITAPPTRSEATLALHAYVLDLCASDTSIDVRDRARFVRQLAASLTVGGGEGEAATGEAAARVILRPRFQAQASYGVLQKRNGFTVGSLSRVVDHRAPGYTDLPPFVPANSDSSLREPAVEKYPAQEVGSGGQQNRRARGGGGQAHINDFYSSGSDSDSDSYSGSGSYSSSGYDSDESGSGFNSDGSGSYSYSSESEVEEAPPAQN